MSCFTLCFSYSSVYYLLFVYSFRFLKFYVFFSFFLVLSPVSRSRPWSPHPPRLPGGARARRRGHARPPYYDILYYTTLHYNILHYTILHYTVLCYTTLYYSLAQRRPPAQWRVDARAELDQLRGRTGLCISLYIDLKHVSFYIDFKLKDFFVYLSIRFLCFEGFLACPAAAATARNGELSTSRPSLRASSSVTGAWP